MFTVLLAGIYTAYKHFSGLDPLKLDPQAVFNNVLGDKIPPEAQKVLDSFKISQKILPGEKQKAVSSVPAMQPGLNLSFRFLLVADSHADNGNLAKALDQAKKDYPDLKFIIGLGDYSDVGTIAELKKAKQVLDSFGLRYFVIPGDHDLWDCRNRNLLPVACFNEVFGSSYQVFTFNNFKFLLLDNSDNYTGFGKVQLKWIVDELEKSKQDPSTSSGQGVIKGIFVFLHEPLFHPSSEHVMGWVTKDLKTEAGGLLFELKDAGVTKVFAGDIHYFSEYSEPKTNIAMTTVGALTIERNAQAPRFAVVSVFEDGSIKAEDIQIKTP